MTASTQLADKLNTRGLTQQVTVVVAGGSCLALMGLRDTTTDVDVVTPLPRAVKDAAREVARERGIRDTWLNSSALAWRPTGLNDSDCEPLITRPALRVVGVPPDALLLMKLNRASDADQADMRRLWPLCTFTTAKEVVAAYRAAYPAEEHDAHLTDYVRTLLSLTE